MSGLSPELVDEAGINRLHDAALWYTTPPADQDEPRVLACFFPFDEVPGDLQTVFPFVPAEVQSYELNAIGRYGSCEHHMERDQPCLSLVLQQYLSVGGLRLHYRLRPERSADGSLAHRLERELGVGVIGSLVHRPDLMPGEVARGIQTPTASEVAALVGLLVDENIPDQRHRDHFEL